MECFVADPAPEALPSDDLRWLLAFWNELCGSRDMPARGDFEPSDLVRLLPFIGLTDVEYNPMRFRIRLLGTGIVAHIGTDLTGKYMDEVAGQDEAIKRHRWITENRRPYCALGAPLAWAYREFSSYSSLTLPLSDDGSRVNMLLYCLLFQ